MTPTLITAPLDKARVDLEDAVDQLAAYWTTTSEQESLSRVASAAEALVRAMSSLTLVVERIAELSVCEGLK